MRTTTFARLIERSRMSALVIGLLLALLVGVGPLQTVSLQPPQALAQGIEICVEGQTDPTEVVQNLDCDLNGFPDLELQAVDAILAAHQLPESDRSRLLAWERDEIRAVMFANLLAMIAKEPAARTSTEQIIVETMARVVKERRVASAQYSLDQYDIWAGSPCTYQAPHGFPYEPDESWCNLPLIQLFDHPDAPTVEDFLNYGLAEISQEFQEDGEAFLITGETARLMGLVGGALAVGIAAWVGGVIGSAIALTTSIATAIHPTLAALVAMASKGIAVSAVKGAAAAAAGALSIGALAAIIVLAVVIIVFQAISVIEQTEIPVRLQEALTQAEAGVDIRQLAQLEEGIVELYSAFILTTVPDFPDEGSVPAAQPTDRSFIITDLQGDRAHSYTINYQCWNPRDCQDTDLAHTARIHAGWFVDESDASGAERMTLEIDYIDWNGDGWTAARIGPQDFLHSRTGDDEAAPFVSEEIKYLDPSGAQLTAVLNQAPTMPATPAPSDTINNGTFQLDWTPAATDADGDPVTYTLIRCDITTVVTVDGVETCDESVVASGLTTTSYAFTADQPGTAWLFEYRVQASDGWAQSDLSAWSADVLIDQQAPEITFASRTPEANAAGWTNTDVTVEWNCTDISPTIHVAPSGVVSETVSETVTAEGADQTVTGACEDNVGNSVSHTVFGISIDKTAPSPLFDGPYIINEGSSIQLNSLSTDALSGVASATFALDGDDQFDDGNPATFAGVEGTSFNPVKLRVEDRAGNVAIAETTVTVFNVAPTIDGIVTNGPVAQGQPVEVTVTASDPGVLDTLSYAFDCDEDGVYEAGPQANNETTCALAPGAAVTTIGVQVTDDDGAVTLGSVDVGQTLTLCLNYWTGALSPATASGGCPANTAPQVLPSSNPTTLCLNPYTGKIRWMSSGICPAGQFTHVVPDSGPLPFCQNIYTSDLRYSWNGVCSRSERPGVIPG